jgi:septum formation protein
VDHPAGVARFLEIGIEAGHQVARPPNLRQPELSGPREEARLHAQAIRRPAEAPRAHALRLALEKARVAAARHPGHVVLAADTVVAAGRRILGKPTSRQDAERMLRLLSGRRHRVWTAVAVVAPGQPARTRLVGTIVTFQRLTDQQVAAYLDSGEWDGKAGGYDLRGRVAAFVRFLSGSHSAVVGLPLFETAQLLRGIGWLRP